MDYPRVTTFCCVCGYDTGEFIWGDDGKCPTFIICSCCGTEFGYEDITPKSIYMRRKTWESEGYKWSDPEKKSEGWNVNKQMQNIPEEFK